MIMLLQEMLAYMINSNFYNYIIMKKGYNTDAIVIILPVIVFTFSAILTTFLTVGIIFFKNFFWSGAGVSKERAFIKCIYTYIIYKLCLYDFNLFIVSYHLKYVYHSHY